jgi:hypothetical protein
VDERVGADHIASRKMRLGIESDDLGGDPRRKSGWIELRDAALILI